MTHSLPQQSPWHSSLHARSAEPPAPPGPPPAPGAVAHPPVSPGPPSRLRSWREGLCHAEVETVLVPVEGLGRKPTRPQHGHGPRDGARGRGPNRCYPAAPISASLTRGSSASPRTRRETGDPPASAGRPGATARGRRGAVGTWKVPSPSRPAARPSRTAASHTLSPKYTARRLFRKTPPVPWRYRGMRTVTPRL